MSGCTTWHIRIDLVDDGIEVSARASLIGAPASMTCLPAVGPHDECLAAGASTARLGGWRPLDELAPRLVDALSCEHGSHA